MTQTHTPLKLTLSSHGEALRKLNDTLRLKLRQQHEEAKLRAEELTRQSKLWLEARRYPADAPAGQVRADVLAGSHDDAARGIRAPELPGYMHRPTGSDATTRTLPAPAFWIVWQDGRPQPMTPGEIHRESLRLISLHDLGEIRRSALSDRLRREREAMALTLKHHRRITPLVKYTDLDPAEAAERFEAQVRAFLTDASFADWDGALAWCQVQTVYGACLNAYSNLNTTADQMGRIAAEGRALRAEVGSRDVGEDDLERLRDRYRKLEKQHAFWEWRLEAACEAYRRIVATVQVTDSGDIPLFRNLPSEWTPPAGGARRSGRKHRPA
ncbi:hypothetical protein IGS68_30210 (plasmid) [Skermanella sp. TT6]|uniref:Uncharacterized protein n=1 Tax=Skermanella cutis TaxID=2775420 RepID=A0ABX7BF80_9PROT|nr:hypothetical protein [Skermanella sp. TT6]QQP92738.1 hypothetical protein IGS68_30210 [Skermanella sp. TT6]